MQVALFNRIAEIVQFGYAVFSSALINLGSFRMLVTILRFQVSGVG